jgi:hypothetical protein
MAWSELARKKRIVGGERERQKVFLPVKRELRVRERSKWEEKNCLEQ